MKFRLIRSRTIEAVDMAFTETDTLVRVSERTDADGCHLYQNLAGIQQWLHPEWVEAAPE
ncbi:hypothetical protein [Roseomonas sp. USHLN139]|uniref:hypothetical protein n=1 Tax=Roseomonas sp. USHLN139 TaxID=3081298 RepID=UPI003B018FC4